LLRNFVKSIWSTARNGGCVGAIVDGSVRDVRQMNEMGFTCFALGVSMYDSLHRQRVVDIDVTVEMDGVKFAPGDRSGSRTEYSDAPSNWTPAL